MRVWAGMALAVWLLAGCSGPDEEVGFAGLADNIQSTDGFEQPAPGDELVFPQDFGPHTAHRIEWWYLTANLETEAGDPLGLQWTQFRQALEPRAQGAPRRNPRPGLCRRPGWRTLPSAIRADTGFRSDWPGVISGKRAPSPSRFRFGWIIGR